VKAVGDLNRIWRSLPGTFSKRAGPITRDNLDAGMSLEPRSEGRRTRIRKHLKWAIGAEVDQDGFEI
jgi:hypothetical protein